MCVAEGVPTPDVYWTHNFVDRLESSQLEVTSTNLTNATNVFYCIAESSVGRSVISVTIHVRIHPVITSPVESYNITLTSLENVSIPIVCLAEGVPSPNVYWTHNFVDRLESSLLEVTSTNLTNATNVFYCVAESSVGRSVISVTIHVRIHPVITSPVESYNITLTSLENVSIPIVCLAEGVPSPNVYWTHNFVDRLESSLLEVTSTNLTNATNVFYCVAESSVGRSVLSVTIHVRIHPVITSPVESYNITLTSLENVSIPIVCLAEGVPSPNVYWTHNFVDRLESSLLEVTSTNLTNATNVFYCVAESSVGRSVISVTIHVRIHPVITSPSHSYTTTLTSIDSVYIPIECLATGIPTPNVYWTYNNAAIQISSTLRVTGALLTDETNTFRCVAENAEGVDIVTVTYVIKISAEELADSLGLLMENLTNVETISDEDAGQTAAFVDNSVSLAISNSSNTAENNNAILEAAANTVELIVNKTNGTFSNETTNIVTDVLGTIVSGGLNQTNRTEPETVSSYYCCLVNINGVLCLCAFYIFNSQNMLSEASHI